MIPSADKARADIERLTKKGRALLLALRLACHPEEIRAALKRQMKDNAEAYIRSLPNFDTEYPRWYTEVSALVKQLIPERLPDFAQHFERPKQRREFNHETYRLEDYLQGLQYPRPNAKDRPLGREAAIPHFQQQLALLDAAAGRLDSVLFDLQQALQGDLLLAELDAADQLARLGSPRAAGVLAGLVIERHLLLVCRSRNLSINGGGTGDEVLIHCAQALHAAGAIDVQVGRLVLHMDELRSLCLRQRAPEPTPEQAADLIGGARRLVKLVF